MGLRLAGIEGIVTNEKEVVLKTINQCLEDQEIGIILCTTKIMQLVPEQIANYKLNLKKPLIVEIPDRHGSAKIGETINRYISEAIGIKI